MGLRKEKTRESTTTGFMLVRDGLLIEVAYRGRRLIIAIRNVGHSCPRMLTAWIPLVDVPPHMGSMMVIPGSHIAEGKLGELRNSYGRMDVGPDGVESGKHICDLFA